MDGTISMKEQMGHDQGDRNESVVGNIDFELQAS